MKTAGLTEVAALLWLEKLMAFCQTDGRACYGAFSPEVLRDYLTFHIRQETLAWVRGKGDGRWQMADGAEPPTPNSQLPTPKIVGVGIAWQCHAEDVIRAAVNQEAVFNWQASDPFGNAIFIADVVATNAQASLALLQRFALRFPAWRELHLYTFRRGKLVMLNARTLHRFFNQQRKI